MDPMSRKTRYDLDFAVPRGWIQLPVLDSKNELRHDRKLQAWASTRAQQMLGTGAAPDQLDRRTQELANLTFEARARRSTYALALYPEPTAAPLALLDARHLIPDRTNPELTFDVLRDLYAEPDADTLGEVEERQADLPGGPALRVRRKRAVSGDPTGQSVVMEGVTWAIRPPGLDDAIVMIMTWTALQAGDRLAAMADTIAGTVKVTAEP